MRWHVAIFIETNAIYRENQTKPIHILCGRNEEFVALRQAVHIAIVLIFDKGEDKDTIATRISQTYTRITQEQEARLVKYNNILFFLFRNMARDI